MDAQTPSGRKRARKARVNDDNESDNHCTPKRRRINEIGDVEYNEILKFVKKHRGSTVSVGEMLDIIMMQGKIRHDHYIMKRVSSPGRKPTRHNATDKVAGYLRRSKDFVGKVWSNYVQGKPLMESTLPGNYSKKSSRVPVVNSVVCAVQAFVRDRRINRTRTVAKDVLDFLVELGYMEVNRDDRKSDNAGLRSVQRFLRKQGYKRGKKKGMMCYRMKQHNIQKRDEYTKKMVEANAHGAQRIVYMDESWNV